MSSSLSIVPKIIVILGPTASGKSELAVKLAKRFNGEVISADSRQIYKGLNIGSGKVPRDKFPPKSYKLKAKSFFHKGIRHHLLDVASPKRVFTVSQYQKLSKQVIKKILKKNKIPIICGGTGLYIDSVIYDLKIPKVPPNPKLRKQLEKLSTEELFKKLQQIDPVRAKNIDRHNPRRLIRALEIVLTTNKPVPTTILTDSGLEKNPKYNALLIGIRKSQEELEKSIQKRLNSRLRIGMIEEVENLHKPFDSTQGKQGLSWKRLDDLGLEYRYISRYLRGLISKKEMQNLIAKESLKYAKRQMTWFKRSPQTYWIYKEKEALPIIKDFIAPLDKN